MLLAPDGPTTDGALNRIGELATAAAVSLIVGWLFAAARLGTRIAQVEQTLWGRDATNGLRGDVKALQASIKELVALTTKVDSDKSAAQAELLATLHDIERRVQRLEART